MVQPQFGNNSVSVSYTGKVLYLVAIAPFRDRPSFQIYNSKCDTLLASGELAIGTNGAEDLFGTGCALFCANLNIGTDISLSSNQNYNVVIAIVDTDRTTKLNQYNFIFQPAIKEQYSDSPATSAEVKSTYIGNQMIEFYKATEDNVTRGVSIGDLDHITYKVKYDFNSDWRAPVSEQTQYVWYFPDGKVEYRKESD